MQIRVSTDLANVTLVEVIDPSDGAVTHHSLVEEGQQIVVTATSAHSPADIEFGEVEAIPSDSPEQADTGEGFEDGGETAEQPTPPEDLPGKLDPAAEVWDESQPEPNDQDAA